MSVTRRSTPTVEPGRRPSLSARMTPVIAEIALRRIQTPELRHNYEVEQLIELLRADQQLDTPETIYDDDALRAEAERMMRDEAQGRVLSYLLEVIIDMSEDMPWAPRKTRKYIAVTPQAGLDGCLHRVDAAGRARARQDAVTDHEHRQHCLGRLVHE